MDVSHEVHIAQIEIPLPTADLGNIICDRTFSPDALHLSDLDFLDRLVTQVFPSLSINLDAIDLAIHQGCVGLLVLEV